MLSVLAQAPLPALALAFVSGSPSGPVILPLMCRPLGIVTLIEPTSDVVTDTDVQVPGLVVKLPVAPLK